MLSILAQRIASDGIKARFRVEYEQYVGVLSLDLSLWPDGLPFHFTLNPSPPKELIPFFHTRIRQELDLYGGEMPEDLSGYLE